MLVIILCGVLCVCVVVAMCRTSKQDMHKLPPATIGGLPIIGHLHILMASRDTSSLWRIVQLAAEDAVKEGGLTYSVLGNQIYYIVADAEDALTLSHVCIRKHFIYDFGKPWFGESAITGSGETWWRDKKLLQPAFSLPSVLGFLDIFNSQAKKLVTVSEPFVGKGPFDINSYFTKNSLETFCLSIFGVRLVMDSDLTQRYMEAVEMGMNMVIERFQNFWQHSDFLFWLFGLKKKEQEGVAILNKISSQIIQRKKEDMKNAPQNDNDDSGAISKKYKALLDIFLELSEKGIFSEKKIREETDTLISAGFETTATQFICTVLLLGEHPRVQNKLYDELIEVLGPDKDVEKDDVNKLVYLNAVLTESVRMYPASPVFLRHIDKDVKLKNYTLRKGSHCVVCPHVHYHDPMWAPDGHQFRPERWLENPELYGKKEFAGFGQGKRSCIGKHYALVALKVFFAHFIRHYKVTGDMSRVRFKVDVLLKPVAGHEISIERRS